MIRVKKCETTGFEPGKSCPGFLYVTLHCWPWTVWFSCVIVLPLLCQFCLPRPSQAGLQWWVGCRGFEFSQDILGYDAYASKRSHACAGVVFWIAVVAEVCQSNYLHGFEKKRNQGLHQPKWSDNNLWHYSFTLQWGTQPLQSRHSIGRLTTAVLSVSVEALQTRARKTAMTVNASTHPCDTVWPICIH